MKQEKTKIIPAPTLLHIAPRVRIAFVTFETFTDRLMVLNVTQGIESA